MKYDAGKVDLSILPPDVLKMVAEVLSFGAQKYGRHNYRLDGDKTKWSRNYASLQRHLNDFWSGEDLDPESGKPHVVHAICQLMILLTQIIDGHDNMDDRYATELKRHEDQTSNMMTIDKSSYETTLNYSTMPFNEAVMENPYDKS